MFGLEKAKISHFSMFEMQFFCLSPLCLPPRQLRCAQTQRQPLSWKNNLLTGHSTSGQHLGWQGGYRRRQVIWAT